MILVCKEREASFGLQDIWNGRVFIFTAGILAKMADCWVVVPLLLFSLIFFFLADRIRMLLKVFPQHFYIYEYLILLLQAKKKKEKKMSLGDFSKKKKSMGLK